MVRLRLVPPWDWTAYAPCPIPPLTHPNARARGTRIEWNAYGFHMCKLFLELGSETLFPVIFLMKPVIFIFFPIQGHVTLTNLVLDYCLNFDGRQAPIWVNGAVHFLTLCFDHSCYWRRVLNGHHNLFQQQ